MQETPLQFLGREDPLEKGQANHSSTLGFPLWVSWSRIPCKAGDLGSIPGLGRSPGKGKATHSSILAWRIPWTVWSMGSQRVRHDWVTFTFWSIIVWFWYWVMVASWNEFESGFQFLEIVWEGQVVPFLYVFGRMSLCSHWILDLNLLGVFWLLIQFYY